MAGKARLKKFHLVGEHVMVGKVEKFVLIGNKWHRQQFHSGHFGAAVRLAIIASAARRHYIGPDVPASAGNRLNMIAGQFVHVKFTATIQTQVFVAAEQEFVFQRRIKIVLVNLAVTGNDTGEPEYRLHPEPVETAPDFEHGATQCPDDLVFHHQGSRLFPGKPGNRQAGFVQSENLGVQSDSPVTAGA